MESIAKRNKKDTVSGYFFRITNISDHVVFIIFVRCLLFKHQDNKLSWYLNSVQLLLKDEWLPQTTEHGNDEFNALQ